MIDAQAQGVRKLLAELAGRGLAVLEPNDWTADQRDFLRAHFTKEILPVLTPLAVEELHPPPLLPGQQWYVAAVLAAGSAEESVERVAVVPCPRSFPAGSACPPMRASAWRGWKT